MRKNILDECLNISRRKIGTHPEYQHYIHYSFIVQGNKIIDWGTNTKGEPKIFYGYHKRMLSGKPKSHSEINAYKKARGLINKLESFECVNIRLNKRKKLRNSAPCKCCYTILSSLGCSSFWFTTNIGWARII
jgi:hypothetical protein